MANVVVTEDKPIEPMPKMENNNPDTLVPIDNGESDRRSSPLVQRLVIATSCIISLSLTIMFIQYSNHSSHVLPLTNAQVCCLLIFLWIIALWTIIHLSALLTASRDHSFARGFRIHSVKLMGEERTSYIRAAAEFAGIMILFYVCDRTDLLPKATKSFNRDIYWFIWVAFLGMACFTIHKDNNQHHIKPLQREQTEEWKGWMQVQFLMYHYFNATDYYNAIRIYIAAYVWMTGFGNFSFYYCRKDFSLARFCAMQWRLNFFVLWCCMFLNNEYMLYYICMLHTTFTVIIYAALGINYEINYTNFGMKAKFLIVSAIIISIWNIPGVFDFLWRPLGFLVNYNNKLHEWHFRSTLDHLVWIFGMLTAYCHPRWDSLLEKLDNVQPTIQYFIKTIVLVVCLLLGYFWYSTVFVLPKNNYNALHPYTSFIPITIYIVLRNLFAFTRQYHVGLLAWMGKITLETYISQFHIWLATLGPNTNPKRLLRLLPADYPLLNFCLVSLLYLYISYRIFQVTNHLKSWALPSKESSVVRHNVFTCLLSLGLVYGASFALNFLVTNVSGSATAVAN